MEKSEATLFFRLDGNDRIVEVGGQWDEFARANDGARLVAERVTGGDFFDHITGDVSRMYVRTVFGGVRALRRPATRAYRCDSPDLKRYMEMTVRPEADDGLRVDHRLLRVEPLPAALRFVGKEAVGNGDLVVRCSMCNRLKHAGRWREPEMLLERLPDIAERAVQVIYGVCSVCFDGLRRA